MVEHPDILAQPLGVSVTVRRSAITQEGHMLVEGLAALAGVAGTALVGAMATAAWQATRAGVARLFGRGGPDRQAAIETQLDSNAALVAQAADPGEIDEIRRSLAGVWRLELAALLRTHP